MTTDTLTGEMNRLPKSEANIFLDLNINVKFPQTAMLPPEGQLMRIKRG
jgi:hypothetical protein